ncbi:MAG: ferrous iron transport protein A [Deltaproteobacteria bacterium]|nr:MAG: ferrous iron transport protein A [Deltaproteobacteria bacterium]
MCDSTHGHGIPHRFTASFPESVAITRRRFFWENHENEIRFQNWNRSCTFPAPGKGGGVKRNVSPISSEGGSWQRAEGGCKVSLSELSGRQFARVSGVEDTQLRMNLLRLGISEGTRIECVTKMPKGAVIVRNQGHEIAIGRRFADQIKVQVEA